MSHRQRHPRVNCTAPSSSRAAQAEHEAIETRTVVNYNHSHALTILYYEVLRHFRVVTEFVRRRPALLTNIHGGHRSTTRC